MIERSAIHEAILKGIENSPGVALLGPRQCGKTTLAREIAARDGGRIFDLENPEDAAALENPVLALQGLRGVVVLQGSGESVLGVAWRRMAALGVRESGF